MGRSYGIVIVNSISKKDIETFKGWLQDGLCCKGLCFEYSIGLSEENAEKIINYLKNDMHILPQSEIDSHSYYMDDESVDIEHIDKLHDFLMNFGLDADRAFSVIYYLQEGLEILPDNIEMCRECKSIIDLDCEGVCISFDSEDEDGNSFDESEYGIYCDYCRPD